MDDNSNTAGAWEITMGKKQSDGRCIKVLDHKEIEFHHVPSYQDLTDT